MGNVNDTLRKIGVPAEIAVPASALGMARKTDPYEIAIEDRRAQQAMRVYEGMDAEAEARRAESQTTKLQAELAALETRMRMMQLQEAMGDGGGDGTKALIVELMKIMQSDKAELAAQNKDLMAQILNVHKTASDAVKEQISQAGAKDGARGHDAMTSITEQITGLHAVMQAIKTFMPQPTSELAAATRSAEEEIRILRAQKEIEFSAMKMREEHEARMADLRLREEDMHHRHTLDMQKFEVDKRRTDGIATTLERFAPHAMAALGDVVKSRLTVPGGAAAAAVPAQAPLVAEDGTETIACPSEACPGSIEVKPGQSTVVCPTCKGLFGAVHTPDPA